MKRLSLVIIAVSAMSFMWVSPGLAVENYGSAGCGLGSLIFGDQAGGIQVIAATTNGTSASQLFGITSGTSNCEKQPKSYSQTRLKEFVVANMDNLAKDIAMGQGESLETVAELMGISAEEKPMMFSKLQENFLNIFTSEKVEAAEVIDNITTLMNNG